MKVLTKRQREILDFISNEIATTRIPPSLRNICEAFGFASVKAASDHVGALRRKGYLATEGHRARSIRVLSPLDSLKKRVVDIPVLGSIPAGPPEEAIQDAEGCLSADIGSLGITKNARTFALKVGDDTLAPVHICKGDVVVFQHAKKPRDGDVVAVLMEGKSVLRVYGLNAQKRGVLRTAANGKKPGIVAADYVIQGVMVALVRRC